MYSFFFFAVLVFFVLVFLNNRSKIVDFLFIILISVFFIFNRHNNDYPEYVKIFKNPGAYAEPGYSYLVHILKLIGADHHNYVLLSLGLFFIVTCLHVRRYIGYIPLFAVCYSIFPLAIDITQIRNTFAMFFFINSIFLYLDEKKIKAYFLLLIGATFHYLGFLFVFLFLLLDFFKKVKKNSFFYMLLAASILLSTAILPVLLEFIISAYRIRNLASYISQSDKYLSFLIWGVPMLSDIIFYNILKKKLITSDIEALKITKFLYLLIIFSLVFLPSTIYMFEINRFFRALFMIKYLLFLSMMPFLSRKYKIYILIYLLASSVVFGYYYHSQIDYDFILFGLGYRET